MIQISFVGQAEAWLSRAEEENHLAVILWAYAVRGEINPIGIPPGQAGAVVCGDEDRPIALWVHRVSDWQLEVHVIEVL